MKTDTECNTNDDALRGGVTTTYDFLFANRVGWIGAGGSPVEDFLYLVCVLAFAHRFLLLLLMLLSFLYWP